MRLFAALRPPLDAVEHLDEFLEVRRAAGDLRWSAADQLHLTLAFAADVPDRALDGLMERVGEAAARRSRFAVGVAGGGAFPDVAAARVVWAGLAVGGVGRTELERLAAGCRTAMSTSGAAVDGQRFRPHLTVARTRHPHDVSNWVRLLDAYRGPAWVADEVELIASHLGEGPRKRPRHEVLAAYALGG